MKGALHNCLVGGHLHQILSSRRRSPMMRLVNFLSGLVIGLFLGGLVAALLAPQSGPQTQERLRRRIEAVAGEARRAAEMTRADAYARLADLKTRQND
jgi:gas vesicle protein